MQNEVVLTCPYKRSIGITNIVYDLWWNDYYGWKPFNPFFCTGRTHTSNDCKSTISYKHLQDQCMWKDTCTVVMDYNPCWSEPLYATIYYKCIDPRYESVVPYPLIKTTAIANHQLHLQKFVCILSKQNRMFIIRYCGTSTQDTNKSTTHLHHKKDDNDDDGDDDDNESQSNKLLKIGLGTALGMTSIISIIALICILKSRRNKPGQRSIPTPCSNRLTNDYDHGFQNPRAYQISVSNPGYSQTMPDRVVIASDSSYALPSYDEAVGNMYEDVNYRTPRATKGTQ
ncbi:unnamed protein product [Mytilus edulis]|uniref:SUEL-type lectin domain-containing protein n=1 Tax=Mytilus edulis TaxID=6550 RepID=A0A8S3U147_MYTED|nr:unnamed protein product [Mytilus edulis]